MLNKQHPYSGPTLQRLALLLQCVFIKLSYNNSYPFNSSFNSQLFTLHFFEGTITKAIIKPETFLLENTKIYPFQGKHSRIKLFTMFVNFLLHITKKKCNLNQHF